MKALVSLLLLVLGLMVLGGCTTRSTVGGFTVKSVSGDGLRVVSVECQPDATGLRIHGRVETQGDYLGSPFHFLEVQLLDTRGIILDAHQVAFYPNPIVTNTRGPGRATYSVQFTNCPPAGGLVLVSVDGLGAY